VSTSFEPRGAVVTGAGRGVGRAVAVELARPGVTVALLARSIDELDETAALVRARGGTPAAIPADLGDPEEIHAAVERAREAGCTIDTLVNNAGVEWPLGQKAGLDPGEWSRAIATNLITAATLTLAVLPDMLAEGRGRVVNVSGGIAKRPDSMIGGTAYVTATTSLEAHTLNLAAALAGTGVTVNAYRQGSVGTAAQGWIRSHARTEVEEDPHQRFVRGQADGALITPEHSARALVGHLRGTGNGRVWTLSTPPESA
jgi:3-oxoacyl-[acyl-carrier protein] reductase